MRAGVISTPASRRWRSMDSSSASFTESDSEYWMPPAGVMSVGYVKMGFPFGKFATVENACVATKMR